MRPVERRTTTMYEEHGHQNGHQRSSRKDFNLRVDLRVQLRAIDEGVGGGESKAIFSTNKGLRSTYWQSCSRSPWFSAGTGWPLWTLTPVCFQVFMRAIRSGEMSLWTTSSLKTRLRKSSDRTLAEVPVRG